MPINPELMAQVKEIAPTDAKPLFAALRERVGEAAFREAFFDALTGPLDEDDFPTPLLVSRFLASLPEQPPMQVEGLIPDKSLVLLAAKPKFCKSLMALDVLECVANGTSIFGHFAVNKPGLVVYVGMEDGPIEIGNRLLKRGHRTNEEDSNFYIIAARVLLNDPVSVARLRQKLEMLKPVMIVIDTGREALGVRDWTDPAELADKLRPLRELAHDFCTVLLVVHNRKAEGADSGDEISGSNALTSSADGWISITKKEALANGNQRLTLSVQGRGGMHQAGGTLVVEMDTDTTHFRLVDGEELARVQQEQQREKEADKWEIVREAVAQIGGRASVKEIADYLSCGLEKARRMVETATKAGVLVEGEKQTGKGRPTTLFTLKAGHSVDPLSEIPPDYDPFGRSDEDEPELF